MIKNIFLLPFVLLIVQGLSAQQYMTRTGMVGFYSKTALEDIKGENNQVLAIIDIGKKNMAFSALLKGFIFPKELMQEHFNENYVESDKYPKAVFAGSYTGELHTDKDGVYPVVVKGVLTLHNASRNIETPATLEVRGGKITGSSEFKVRPEDFGISIPSLVRDKIAKDITVRVRIECSPK